MRLLRTDDRAVTAIHEAGHCLAHLHFGQDFDDVQLGTDSKLPFNQRTGLEVAARGMVTHAYRGSRMFPRSYYEENYPAYVQGYLRQAEAELACSYAGPIAQARFMRYSLWASILCGGGQGDIEFVGAVLEHWWPDKAEQRRKELSAERRARKLIRSERGWQVIRTIAEQLYERGTLDFEECSAAYVQVYGREPKLLFVHDEWGIDELLQAA